jgi:cold shock CspA family protein
VKSLANGYGIITRKDGRGDVQFMSGHVMAPGFDFVEVGDTMRFDVVRMPSGKWLAQRVVRS